ncbi:hypothetical protein AYO49_04530 [Verrucomicrobiaceae bacterium SCGC AG-212-N21]|nr:hypothetical protein AYO49_04530 [Verrucomicrobiaceae bacterium SCGC AG-212-N21]
MARLHWELERLGLKPEPFYQLQEAMGRAELLVATGFGPIRLVEVCRHKGGQLRSVVRVFKISKPNAR